MLIFIIIIYLMYFFNAVQLSGCFFFCKSVKNKVLIADCSLDLKLVSRIY